jgi:hypothetical protein
VGISSTVPLILAFVAVCAAEAVVGVLLWTGAPHAGAVSLVLLPFELVFWIGFALPLGPPVGIARAILVLLA